MQLLAARDKYIAFSLREAFKNKNTNFCFDQTPLQVGGFFLLKDSLISVDLNLIVTFSYPTLKVNQNVTYSPYLAVTLK